MFSFCGSSLTYMQITPIGSFTESMRWISTWISSARMHHICTCGVSSCRRLGGMIKDSGRCIRVGWISQTPVTMRGWSCLYPDGWVFIDGTRGQEKGSRWERCPVHGKTTNKIFTVIVLVDPSLNMTEIKDSTIKPQSSSINWSVKTGMTGCISVTFSLNKFLSILDMFFTLVVLLQTVNAAQAIGKHFMFYMYTAYCYYY